MQVGGGDPAALACLGEPATEETEQLQTLAHSLGSCQHNIELSCTNNLLDMDMVEVCKQEIKKYKAMLKSCGELRGCEACQCWSSDNLSYQAQIVRKCNLSSVSKLTAVQSKYCRGNFSSCRGYEDASISAIASCGRTAESLLLTAKRLKYNFDILGDVKKRSNRLIKSITAIIDPFPLSCSEILKSNDKMLDNVIQNPLAVLDLEEMDDDSLLPFSVSALPVGCSQEDIMNLHFQMKLLDSATQIILNILSSIQEKLKRKYFFDSVLGFMKFLTDESSK